jgi:hypothetical protein
LQSEPSSSSNTIAFLMRSGAFVGSIACFLASCTSEGSQLAPTAPLQPSTDRSAVSMHVSAKPLGALKGEILVGHRVRVKPCTPPNTHVTFNASGTAKGPYAGSFTATGSWDIITQGIYHLLKLDEQFTITTATSSVSGTIYGHFFSRGSCDLFPKTKYLHYTVAGVYQGTASTTGISSSHFGETLH